MTTNRVHECSLTQLASTTLKNNIYHIIPYYSSDWVIFGGAMPQDSWLGSLIFIILIDDLRPQPLTHKYIDNTLSEIIAKKSTQIG